MLELTEEKMKRERPFNLDHFYTVTILEKEDSAIVFCTTCRRILHKGDDRKPIVQKVIQSQIGSHLDAYSELHSIDVVHRGET